LPEWRIGSETPLSKGEKFSFPKNSRNGARLGQRLRQCRSEYQVDHSRNWRRYMTAETARTVAIVIHAPQWGGLHALVERIEPDLRSAGWRATVILPCGENNGADRFRAAGIRTKEIILGRIRKTANPLTQIRFALQIVPDILRLRRVLRDEQADVVQICGL